jgi:hypothetical protein
MFGWFKNKKQVYQSEVESKPEVPVVSSVVQPEVPSPVAKPKRAKSPRKPKTPKPVEKVEPKVEILKFDFDPNNPKIGSIELDWNDQFVELLQFHGYAGQTAEDIVDAWLNDVCRNIIQNQYQGQPIKLAGSNLINKKDIGNGKTEVS